MSASRLGESFQAIVGIMANFAAEVGEVRMPDKWPTEEPSLLTAIKLDVEALSLSTTAAVEPIASDLDGVRESVDPSAREVSHSDN